MNTVRHVTPEVFRAVLEPHLSSKKGESGGTAENNRLFMEGILWRVRNGARWRDILEHLGK